MKSPIDPDEKEAILNNKPNASPVVNDGPGPLYKQPWFIVAMLAVVVVVASLFKK